MSADIIRVTIKERVVLHLADYIGYDDDLEVPHDLCQEGIAIALVVDRSQVTKALAELREMDFVIERLLHVEGSRRRRKAYCLTPPGFDYSRRLREHLLPKIVDFVDDEDRLLEMPIGEIWQFMKHRIPFQRIITEAQRGSVTYGVLIEPPEPAPEGPVAAVAPPAIAPAPSATPAPTPAPASQTAVPISSPAPATIEEPPKLAETGHAPPIVTEARRDISEEGPGTVEPPVAALAPAPAPTPPKAVAEGNVEPAFVTPKEKFQMELKRRVKEKEAAKKGKMEEKQEKDKGSEEAEMEELEKGREAKRRQLVKEGKVQKVERIVLPSAQTASPAAQGPSGPPPDLMMMPDGAKPPTQGYYPQYIQFYGPPDTMLPVDVRARMRPKGYLMTSGVILLLIAAIFTLPMTDFNLPFCVISLAMTITGGILFVVHWEGMRASGFETMDTVTRRGVMAMALGFALVGTLHLATLQGSHPDFKNAAYGVLVIASVMVPLLALGKLDRGSRAALAIALGTLIVLLFLGTSILTSGERLAANQVPSWIVVGIALIIFGKELDEMPTLTTLRSAVPGAGIGITYLGVLGAIGPKLGMLAFACIAAWIALGVILAVLPLLPVKGRAKFFDSLGLGAGVCGGLCLLLIGIIMVIDGIHIGLIEVIIGFVVTMYGVTSMKGVPRSELEGHVAVIIFLVVIEVLTIINVMDQLRALTSLG